DSENPGPLAPPRERAFFFPLVRQSLILLRQIRNSNIVNAVNLDHLVHEIGQGANPPDRSLEQPPLNLRFLVWNNNHQARMKFDGLKQRAKVAPIVSYKDELL